MRNERDTIGELLAAIEGARVPDADVYAPDVAFDATVPSWRFQRQGADAVRAELATWYAAAGRFEEVSRSRRDGGELVEFTLDWTEADVPHRCHQVHLLDLSGGLISSHRVWCGGRWPASLVAEMRAAGSAV
jgi:hypothetical protein